MLKTLTIVYREGLEEGTYFYPVLRLLAALRIMFFPNTIIRLAPRCSEWVRVVPRLSTGPYRNSVGRMPRGLPPSRFR